MTRDEVLREARLQVERRMRWEATLTDEQRWGVESGGWPLRMPDDFEDNEQEER
jgi:hypothetical protein